MAKDWREVEINVGDTVVYSSGSRGGGTNTVEAQVLEVIPKDPNAWRSSDRVKVHIFRRTDDYVWDASRFLQTLDSDKVTVVHGLPESTRKRYDEKIKAHRAKRDEAKAEYKAKKAEEKKAAAAAKRLAAKAEKLEPVNLATHILAHAEDRCTYCGLTGQDLRLNACPDDVIRYSVDD